MKSRVSQFGLKGSHHRDKSMVRGSMVVQRALGRMDEGIDVDDALAQKLETEYMQVLVDLASGKI